jgi:hypothetical protein
MNRFRRTQLFVSVAGLLLVATPSTPVSGQASFATSYQTTDFSGEWTSTGKGEPALAKVVGEDPHEIGFTADLYDYSGLPFNDAGRMRADTGDISDWSIPEFVCRPHPGVYNWFYGGGFRITKEIDPISRELTAYHVQFLRAPDRPIYMDGRPHPPEWAPHTWAGFSTGRYDGNTLVITTTHLKESYIRANTALFSEKSTVTEYLMLDGNYLTVTTLLEDPVYMEEPHLQSVSFIRSVHQELPNFPCTVGVENVVEGFPHFLPGKNPYLTDAAKAQGIPVEALRGGAETLYPEYREKLRRLPIPQRSPK